MAHYHLYAQEELVDLGKQFWQKAGNLGSLPFLRFWNTGVGPEPMGGLWVLTERSRGWHARLQFENVKDPKGGLSWQGPTGLCGGCNVG